MELLAVIDWTQIFLALIVLTNTIATAVLTAIVRRMDRRDAQNDQRAAERRGRTAERVQVATRKRAPRKRKPSK